MKRNPAIADLLRPDQTPDQVTVAGWVNGRRDHGGLIFIDLRDSSALLQLVFSPEDKALFEQASQLRPEWVIEVGGRFKKRQADLVNPKLLTGEYELEATALRILNRAETPPIPIKDDQTNAAEDKRLLYRYLDLRRPRMQANLKLRAKFYKFLRDFMEKEGFLEVPTPILANSSPEGARDFLVPSRLHPDRFYALPQAPQQFKQLLMVGGVERYYQIAACFRDEDPRADRLYGDFYQLDLEMAFVEDSRVVQETVEPLVESLIVDFAKKELSGNGFVSMTYGQALERYGSDKPDLRFGLELTDVGEVFATTGLDLFRKALQEKGSVKALKVDSLLTKKDLDQLITLAQTHGAGGLAHLFYESGQWSGPIAKFLKDEERQRLGGALKLKDGQAATLLLVAGRQPVANLALGAVRARLGQLLRLTDPGTVSAVWITDFPLYEKDPDSQQLAFAHNPFSRPKGDLNQEDKLSILADQFDLVLNGYEICSGAARNHDPQQLALAFKNAGYDPAEVESQFGALLTAFRFGAPPHAGCAFGLDRLLMILADETNIRELVAFPKNGSGVDLMMDSPTSISKQQRKELGL